MGRENQNVNPRVTQQSNCFKSSTAHTIVENEQKSLAAKMPGNCFTILSEFLHQKVSIKQDTAPSHPIVLD
jgi:hypothetical protein